MLSWITSWGGIFHSITVLGKNEQRWWSLYDEGMIYVQCRLEIKLWRQRHVNGDEMVVALTEHDKSHYYVCQCMPVELYNHGTHTTCLLVSVECVPCCSSLNWLSLLSCSWGVWIADCLAVLQDWANENFLGRFFNSVITDLDVAFNKTQGWVCLCCYAISMFVPLEISWYVNSQIFSSVDMFQWMTTQRVRMQDRMLFPGEADNFTYFWAEYPSSKSFLRCYCRWLCFVNRS